MGSGLTAASTSVGDLPHVAAIVTRACSGATPDNYFIPRTAIHVNSTF